MLRKHWLDKPEAHLWLQVHVEIKGFEFILASGFAPCICSHSEEVNVVDAWNLYGCLEAEEDAFPCTLLWLKRKQVLAFVCDAAGCYFIVWMPNKDLAERALARAILAHDGCRLPGS